jgi:hypothetical protein
MKMSYSRRTRRAFQREGAEEEAGQHGARTCPGVTGPKTSILPGGAGGQIPGRSTGTGRDQRRSGAGYWDSGSGGSRSGKVVYMWGLKRAGPCPQQEEGR